MQVLNFHATISSHPHFPCPLPLFLSSLVTFSGCLANRLLTLAPPSSLH